MLGGGMGEHEEGVQLAIIGYVRELRYAVMQGASLEEAHEQLLARVRRQFARHPDIVEEQEAALAEALHLERAQRDKVSYWRKAALKAGRPDWYGGADEGSRIRSEEHTSELQSLMRISYAVFCFKKKQTHNIREQLK